MNSSQSLNIRYELDMSNFMIVLEFTVQTLYTCLGTKESNRLCIKTVYGGVSEKFYKVEFNCGSPNSTLSQNKRKRRQISAQCGKSTWLSVSWSQGLKRASYITNAWFRLCWQKGHHFFQKRMENLGSSVFKCSFFGAPFVAITDYEGMQCFFNPRLVRCFHSQMTENAIELV